MPGPKIDFDSDSEISLKREYVPIRQKLRMNIENIRSRNALMNNMNKKKIKGIYTSENSIACLSKSLSRNLEFLKQKMDTKSVNCMNVHDVTSNFADIPAKVTVQQEICDDDGATFLCENIMVRRRIPLALLSSISDLKNDMLALNGVKTECKECRSNLEVNNLLNRRLMTISGVINNNFQALAACQKEIIEDKESKNSLVLERVLSDTEENIRNIIEMAASDSSTFLSTEEVCSCNGDRTCDISISSLSKEDDIVPTINDIVCCNRKGPMPKGNGDFKRSTGKGKKIYLKKVNDLAEEIDGESEKPKSAVKKTAALKKTCCKPCKFKKKKLKEPVKPQEEEIKVIYKIGIPEKDKEKNEEVRRSIYGNISNIKSDCLGTIKVRLEARKKNKKTTPPYISDKSIVNSNKSHMTKVVPTHNAMSQMNKQRNKRGIESQMKYRVLKTFDAMKDFKVSESSRKISTNYVKNNGLQRTQNNAACDCGNV